MTSIRMQSIDDIKKFPRKILLFIFMVFFLLAIGTIGFKIILNTSIGNAFITTIESFALMYHPESSAAKVFGISITLFGVILLWWTLWSIFDIFLEGNIGEYLKISKFLNKLEKMRNHYIIAGGGRVGEEIAKSLQLEKKEYIIIEKEVVTFSRLKKSGLFAIHGDVTDENILKKANIQNAKAIIIAMPETEKNLLVTMTARELNKDIDIYARADKPAFVSKLKKAGAKIVIVPELVAAERFLESIK
jgi:hypothetical protein